MKTIEARALTLFLQTEPFASLQVFHPAISIPRLLKHHEPNHVLIIQDLGNHPTLDVWLRTPDLPQHIIVEAGSTLGNFLADFHLSTSREDVERLSRHFENKDVQNVVFTVAVEPIKAILERFQVPDAVEIYDAILHEFNDSYRRDPSNKVFSMGDLWPPSILVKQSGNTSLGLIDWEFACVAPPSQDMGQLGISPVVVLIHSTATHLQVAILANQFYSTNFTIFAESLHRTYGNRLRDKQAWWLSSDVDPHIRSLWIIYGQELINSVNRSRDCGCEVGPSDSECFHQRRAVEMGLWYIREAMNRTSFGSISEKFLTPLYRQEIGG